MKSLGVGCLGTLLGLVLGVILLLAADLFVGTRGSSDPVVQPVDSGQPDVTVVTRAAFLNTEFQAAVKQNNLARSATIAFSEPNAARISMPVDVTLLGQTLTVDASVSAHAIVQNGRIVVVVDNVDVGGMNVAGSLVKQPVERARVLLEGEMNRLMQQELQGTGFRLINLDASPESVTLQFKYGK
jgi:hypothetical protein